MLKNQTLKNAMIILNIGKMCCGEKSKIVLIRIQNYKRKVYKFCLTDN